MRKIFVKLGDRIVTILKSEEGNNMVAGIIISAIVLIAIVLLNQPIRTFVADIWDLFSNFIEGKLTTLFAS